jgi:CheY-like chemotaxis protein
MKRILIADDRPSSRELVRAVLEPSGYEIIEAANGREALEKAEQSQIDLLLLDLHMPEVDGYGVASALRTRGEYAHIPIVALTASAMQDDRERAIRAGFSVYMAKPIDLQVLRMLVQDLLA